MNDAIKNLPEADRIYLRGLEADRSLALHRACKAKGTIHELVQQEKAEELGRQIARFWNGR